MPAQDPSLQPPGQNQGPFSEYLDPVKSVEQAGAMQQRPSGFMGTGGKLAMFGSQLLKGLAIGKMQAYAKKEQQTYEKYDQASKRVAAINQDPDVPNKVKAKLNLYLQQSWATQTQEQLKDLKKHHGKDEGPGAKVRDFLGNIADKLGGPTPVTHSMGGTPDTREAFDKLNEEIANVYTVGGEKYSNKAAFAKAQSTLTDAAAKYGDWHEAAKDPAVAGAYNRLMDLDSKKAQGVLGLLKEGLTPTPVKDIQAEEYAKQFGSSPPAPQPVPVPPQRTGPGPQISGSPTPQQALVPGMPGVVQPATEQAVPVVEKSDTPVKETAKGPSVAEGGVSFPLALPGTTKPAKDQAALDLWAEYNGGKARTPTYYKQTDKDGKITKTLEGYRYLGVPGLVQSTTGELVNTSGGVWQEAVLKEMTPPAPPKPEKVKPHVVGTQGLGGTRIDKDVPLGEPYTPFKSPGKPVKGRSAGEGKPPTFAQVQKLKKDRNTVYSQEQAQWGLQKKYGDAAKQPVDAVIVNPMSKSGAKITVTNDLKRQWDEASKDAKSKAMELHEEVKGSMQELSEAQNWGKPQRESEADTPVKAAPQQPAAPQKAPPNNGAAEKHTEDEVRKKAIAAGKDPDAVVKAARDHGLI